MFVNWRKWGFGFSIEFDDPAFLRIWLGPIRFGWKYGHVEEDQQEESNICHICKKPRDEPGEKWCSAPHGRLNP